MRVFALLLVLGFTAPVARGDVTIGGVTFADKWQFQEEPKQIPYGTQAVIGGLLWCDDIGVVVIPWSGPGWLREAYAGAFRQVMFKKTTEDFPGLPDPPPANRDVAGKLRLGKTDPSDVIGVWGSPQGVFTAVGVRSVVVGDRLVFIAADSRDLNPTDAVRRLEMKMTAAAWSCKPPSGRDLVQP